MMSDDFNNPYIYSEMEKMFGKSERHRRTIAALSLALVAAVILIFALAGMYLSEKNKAVAASAEASKLKTENSAVIKAEEKPPVQLDGTRHYFKDGLIGEAWLPVIEGVEKNTYINENFDTDENGFLCYYDKDGRLASYAGIDISYHQEDIDWDKVAASGVDFVIIRAGYRGYESGDVNRDKTLHDNIQGASDAGLDVGIYFFSQAVSVEEAVDEANYVIEELDGYEITYPVVYDWEIIGTDPARTDEVTADVVTDCAVTFCEIIKDNGYTPMVYSSRRLAYFKYDLGRLKDYDLWLAEYSDTPTMFYNFDIWQYSCTGQIDGIEGDVDMNICFKDYTGKQFEK